MSTVNSTTSTSNIEIDYGATKQLLTETVPIPSGHPSVSGYSEGKGMKKFGRAKLSSSQKRQAIYQATLEACQIKGIGNATTAEISQRAGIAAGTLFCHYPSKGELLNAIYREIIVNVTDYVCQELRTVPEYNREGQLRKLWQCYVQWYKDHPLETSFLSMIVHPNGESSPYISEKILEELAPCYNGFKKIFQAAVEQGIVRPLPPLILLRIFTANSMTVASLYQVQGSASIFLKETPQILSELENAAWNLIAFRAPK